MKSVVRTIVTLAALGLAGTVASTSARADQPAPVEEPSEPSRAAHSIVDMIGEALSTVSLRSDQMSALLALGSRVEPIQARLDATENGLSLALANQVPAGRIDRTALRPLVDEYVNTHRDVSADLHGAIERLHEILDPAQRAQFVDALESRIHAREHAIVSSEKIDQMKQRLDLSDEQVQCIRDIVQSLAPALEAAHAPMHHALEAFRGESFSIEQYLPQSEVSEHALAKANRIIDTIEAIMNVLDAQQRERLAGRMRQAVQTRQERAGKSKRD